MNTDTPLRATDTLFRYVGLNTTCTPYTFMPASDPPDNFGLRLPLHPAAPATEPPTMPTKTELGELIEVLRGVEARSKQAATHGDMAKLATDVLAGLAVTDKKVDDLAGALHTVQGIVGAQGLALVAVANKQDSFDKRLTIVETRTPRIPSPTPRGYNPEETSPGGDLKVQRAEWESLQSDLHTLIKERNEANAAKATAARDQQIIVDYAKKLETDAATKRKRTRNTIVALIPVATALGGLINHFLAHL